MCYQTLDSFKTFCFSWLPLTPPRYGNLATALLLLPVGFKFRFLTWLPSVPEGERRLSLLLGESETFSSL